jgi:hypothetical protein
VPLVLGPDGNEELGPEHASVALARADQAQAAVRCGSRWTARYLASYVVATWVFFPLLGLGTRLGASVVVTCLWTAFVLGSAWYAQHQRVAWWGFRRLYLASYGSWGVLWVGAVALGLGLFQGRPAYWVPTGLAVSVPLLVSARISLPR